jgi:tRNA(Ile)-lysidine synthetase-like protein
LAQDIWEKFKHGMQPIIGSFDSTCLTEKKCTNTAIALAVSGGADSMCMAAMALKLQQSGIITSPIHCIIIDHRLRSESTMEAQYVSKYLSTRGLKNTVLTWEHDGKIFSNVHHKARQIRYKLMLSFCNKHNIQFLCTAHTQNDQAETILMHIMRGSGIKGIAGIMPAQVMECGVHLIRPMLQITRAEIEHFLKKQHWEWINDPSNKKDCYDRTKIRKLIAHVEQNTEEKQILKEPGINNSTNISFSSISKNISGAQLFTQRLVLLGKNAARAEAFLNKCMKKSMKEISYFSSLGYAMLDIQQLCTLDDEIILRILRKMLLRIGGMHLHLRLAQLESLQIKLQDFMKHHLIQQKTQQSSQNTKKHPPIPGEDKTIGFKKHTLAGCNISVCEGYYCKNLDDCEKKDKEQLSKRPMMLFMKEQKFVDSKRYTCTSLEFVWDKRFKIKLPHLLTKKLKKEAYITSCNLETWRKMKQHFDIEQCWKQYDKIQLNGKDYSVKLPYHEILMRTPVVFSRENEPIYFIAFDYSI